MVAHWQMPRRDGALVTVAAGGAALLLPAPRPSARPPLPRRPRRKPQPQPQPQLQAHSHSQSQPQPQPPERALAAFADCVSGDLEALNRRFVDEGDVSFAAWKRLWRGARLSAAFHAEFWNSSASTTHKTILQRALDALLLCVGSNEGAFGDPKPVAQLFGFAFGLYCAYSVQLGSPKHKIDIVPSGWARLTTLEVVARGPGALHFPLAAKEVRTMMHKLVITENAFLKCLRGFSHTHQLGLSSQSLSKVVSRSSRSEASDSLLGVHEHMVEDTHLEALQALATRHHELVEQVNNASDSTTSATRQPGSGRDLSRGIVQLSVSQSLTDHGQVPTLFDSLRSYLTLRRAGPDPNLLVVADEQETAFEQDMMSESSFGSSNLRDLEEELLHAVNDSSASQTPEEPTQSVQSHLLGEHSTSSGIDPDNPQLERRQSIDSQLSSLASVVSDGLDELEAELTQNVYGSGVSAATPAPSKTLKSTSWTATTLQARSSARSTRKSNSQQTSNRTQQPTTSAPVPEVLPPLARSSSAQNNSESATKARTEGRLRTNVKGEVESTAARSVKPTHRYSVSSDGLDELEAELMENVRRGVEILAESDMAEVNRAMPVPPATSNLMDRAGGRQVDVAQARSQVTSKASMTKKVSKRGPKVRTSMHADVVMAPTPYPASAPSNTLRLRARAPSIADSDGLSELEAELSQNVAQQVTVSATRGITDDQIDQTQANRLAQKMNSVVTSAGSQKRAANSSLSNSGVRSRAISVAESDGLSELEAELSKNMDQPVTVAARNVPDNKINTTNAGQQDTSTKKLTEKRILPAVNASSSNLVVRNRVPSIAESDGLSELEDELSRNVLNQATTLAMQMSSRASKPPTTAKRRRVVQPRTRGRGVSALVSSTDPTSTVLQAQQRKPPTSTRHRIRAHSVAKSDGLSELEVELSQNVVDQAAVLVAAPAYPTRQIKTTQAARKPSLPKPRAKRARTQAESSGAELPQASSRRVRRRTEQSAVLVSSAKSLPALNVGEEVATGFSTRSNFHSRAPSIADNDGLSELEAELSRNVLNQAAGSANPPAIVKKKRAAKSKAQAAGLLVLVPAPRPEAATATSQHAGQANAPISTRLRSRASSIAESDGLSELEAELSQSVLDQATALTTLGTIASQSGPKSKSTKRPAARARKRAVKPQARIDVSALVSAPGIGTRTTPGALAQQSQLPTRTRAIPSRASSVAESDGLSELEAELSQDVRVE